MFDVDQRSVWDGMFVQGDRVAEIDDTTQLLWMQFRYGESKGKGEGGKEAWWEPCSRAPVVGFSLCRYA